jgi:hypothetical protein
MPAPSPMASIERLFESIFAIFGSAAAHGVTQKPTPLINQGLRHNCQ